jgi:hypothetical protein
MNVNRWRHQGVTFAGREVVAGREPNPPCDRLGPRLRVNQPGEGAKAAGATPCGVGRFRAGTIGLTAELRPGNTGHRRDLSVSFSKAPRQP